MIFFCFYVKNGYLKKDIFYDDFFKTLPYFLYFFFPFLQLAARPLLSFAVQEKNTGECFVQEIVRTCVQFFSCPVVIWSTFIYLERSHGFCPLLSGWACQLRFFYVFSPSFSFFLYWAVGLVWLRLSSEASLLCLFGWAFLFSFFVPLRLGPSYVVGLLLLFFFFLPLFSAPRRGPSSSVELLLLFSSPFGWAVINLGPCILKPLATKHQICHSLQSTYEKQKTN